jgi:hypothetical protein
MIIQIILWCLKMETFVPRPGSNREIDYRNRNRNTLLNQLRTLRVYNLIQWLQWLEYITQIKLINYNSDLPGGKQATKGDNKLTVIYYMDYSPLSNIRQHNEMGVADSLLGDVDITVCI